MEHSFVLLAGDARLRALLHLLEEKGISALHLTACRSPAALEAAVAIAKTLVLLVPVQEEWSGIEPDEAYAMHSAQEEERWEREAEARQQISDAASDLTRKIVTWGSFLLPDEEEDIR